MSRHIRLVTSVVVATTLVSFITAPVVGQTNQGLVTISANSMTRTTDFQESEARVDRMIRDGELQLIAVHGDRQLADRQHEAFAQYFEGVRVYGGNVSRQTVQGATVSIFGTIYAGIDLDPSPTLGIGEIGLAIEQQFGAALFQDLGQLTILPTLDGGYALAYRMLLSDATTYFLDARSGAVLLEIDEKQSQSVIGSGTGALGDAKKVSAKKISRPEITESWFEARDELRPGEIVTLDSRGSRSRANQILLGNDRASDTATDTDNTWTDVGVVDAHVHLGWTYDYFFKTHAWSGFDGFGARITSTVNTYSVLRNKAFFIRPPYGPNRAGMLAFGETYEGNPMSTADIVGHELMHGVTYYSVSARTGSGLTSTSVQELGPSTVLIDGSNVACADAVLVFPSGASYTFYCNGGKFLLTHNPGGAVNEAFADVFGTAAEFYMQDPGTGVLRADYQIGEDVPEMGVFHGARGPIRSLSDPASIYVNTSAQTVRYPEHSDGLLKFGIFVASGRLYRAPVVFLDNTYFKLNGTDGGGVHWNATLISHVFYLAVEGGTNGTSGLTVTGVGATNRNQIEQVFFRAMTELMPNTVTIPLVADIIDQAAIDLFGAGSPVAQAVGEALSAVGL